MPIRNAIASLGGWVRGLFEATAEYDETYLEYLDYKYIQTPPNRDDGNCRCNICGALFDDIQETIDHVGGHNGTGRGEIDPFEGWGMPSPLSGRDEAPDPVASAVAEETAASPGHMVEPPSGGPPLPDFDLPDECPRCGFEPDDPAGRLIDEQSLEVQSELLDTDPDSHWRLATETSDDDTSRFAVRCPGCSLEVVTGPTGVEPGTVPGA
ncbi:hypothetical protein HTZ84_22375 [Haloterrigena sp. SYSU A558-1]|uniref:C2H2-type domain-containing protein n=1 Tax=Haloterrigena gelatinilytica TaxID=2741724 RepID=A0ABX2LPF1_9EURY|nr:hypothetical protein [Haloterrigena gelatinilytica]NUC75014.1 hypothetical protein [Haloterrigena gelatinilytica]